MSAKDKLAKLFEEKKRREEKSQEEIDRGVERRAAHWQKYITELDEVRERRDSLILDLRKLGIIKELEELTDREFPGFGEVIPQDLRPWPTAEEYRKSMENPRHYEVPDPVLDEKGHWNDDTVLIRCVRVFRDYSPRSEFRCVVTVGYRKFEALLGKTYGMIWIRGARQELLRTYDHSVLESVDRDELEQALANAFFEPEVDRKGFTRLRRPTYQDVVLNT